MTFVAQPYEQFVDDLLTALTGGFIREEHRFEAAADRYPMSSTSVIRESVKVVGRRGGAFHVFARGIDFGVDEETSEIAWLEDGIVPDEHSSFYVNYYPTEGLRQLTERNHGSVTATLAEAFSRQFAVLHKQMELIYRSAFLEFASGPDLDHLANLVNLTRRDQRYATGEVLFKRSTPSSATIVIPSGTLVSTLAGHVFETTEVRRLRRGQLSVAAPVRARLPGSEGIVDAGTIIVINEPLLGIETLVNSEDTHVEAQRETDDQLRRRIQGALVRSGRSTRTSILRGLIEEVPEVTDGNVRIVEHMDQPGLVEIQFGLDRVDEDTRRRIDDAILRHRAAGVRVIHNLGSPESAADEPAIPSVAPTDRSASPSTPLPDDLRGTPGGVLPLRFEILYRLGDGDAGATRREEIEDDLRQRVGRYVDGLGMDSDVIHSKLLGRIVEPDAIDDATLRLGITGRDELHATNLASAGRKATIRDLQNDVFVGPMAEAVTIDVVIHAEPRPVENGERPVTGRWEAAVRDRLTSELGGSEASTLSAAEIERLVVEALEPSPFQPIRGEVSFEATFEASGRFLVAPATIDLAPHHDIVFRRVTLDVTSSLDE